MLVDKKSSVAIFGSCDTPNATEDKANDKQFFGFLLVDFRNRG